MIRIAALALALAASAMPAAADSRDQLLAKVGHELGFFVPGVDPNTLTTSQLARIYGVMHRDLSHSSKVGQIRSILGGRNSLRGLLFGEAGVRYGG